MNRFDVVNRQIVKIEMLKQSRKLSFDLRLELIRLRAERLRLLREYFS